MGCRSTAPIVVLLAFALAAAPVAAQDGERAARPKRWGAIVGTAIGTAAGVAAGVTFYNKYDRGRCRDYDDDHIFRDCALPITALVAGGGVAGYFIGRAADRTSRASSVVTPQAAGPEASVMTIPRVRLRGGADERRASRRLYARLFTGDAGPVP